MSSITRFHDNCIRLLLACALLCLIVLQPLASWAADDTEQEESAAVAESTATTEQGQFRGQITVTDTPIIDSTLLDDLASLVTSVSAQQIDDLNAQDLSAALRRVPGVVVSRYNPIGAFGGGDGGALFIRGHGSGRPGSEIVTLTDGVPRFVGIWAHPLLDALSLDTASRVDVYRSAQPVLLGTMAFGAVNMVSKRRSEPGFGGSLIGSFGSFGTTVGRVEAGGREGDIDWLATASHRDSDGHRPGADGRVQAASGRFGLRFGEAWDLSIQVDYSDASVGDPGSEDAPRPPIQPRYDTQDTLAIVTLSHHHGSRHGSIKLYAEDGVADWLQWDSTTGEAFRSLTDWANAGIRLRESWSPWSGGEIVAGVDHDRYGGEFIERHLSGDRLATDLELSTTAPYLMVTHSAVGKISVQPSLGLRYSLSSHFVDEWGGQAGLKVGVGRHQVYVNAARAYNLPGIWAAVQYGGWGRGDEWQDLEAETVRHFEIGWLLTGSNGLRLDLSLFADHVNDALRFVPPPPPPPQFANIGGFRSRGAELSLSMSPFAGLSLFTGVTVSDATPDDVPNLPELTATVGLVYSWANGWRLNLDAEYVDERFVLNPRYAASQAPVDAYTLIDGRLGLQLEQLHLKVAGELFVAVENAGDEQYEHRLGYPMPGRTVTGGVQLRF